MTWFLFGRFGTPALLAILGRKAMEGVGAVRAAATADVEFWRGPINALKAEHEWFKKEAQHLMELLTLPVLQLVADRKSTRLNSSHSQISYAVFCLKKKRKRHEHVDMR